VPSKSYTYEVSWSPSKITTTDEYVFYDVAYYVNEFIHMWIYYHGSSDEAKNFSCSLSFVSKSGDKFNHSGRVVHTFDENKDDIIASGAFFAVPVSAMESSFIRGEKSIYFELTITNLKEKVKDDDIESGVSECE